jgi:hypothetical protein
MQAERPLLIVVLAVALLRPSFALPASSPILSSDASLLPARRIEGRAASVVLCAGSDANPLECQFTAPATDRYSLLWTQEAAFDIVKLGVSRAHACLGVSSGRLPGTDTGYIPRTRHHPSMRCTSAIDSERTSPTAVARWGTSRANGSRQTRL